MRSCGIVETCAAGEVLVVGGDELVELGRERRELGLDRGDLLLARARTHLRRAVGARSTDLAVGVAHRLPEAVESLQRLR
jgi:hypothetical protein